MAERATDSVVEQRVSQVYEMLLRGYSRSEVFRFASEQKWGITERQVENYIARATEAIREDSEERREQEFARAVLDLYRLYRRCLKDNQLKTALECRKEIHKLYGLYAPTKNVNINSDVSKLSDTEIEAEIARLERLATGAGEASSDEGDT